MNTQTLANEIILSMSSVLDNSQLTILRNVLSDKLKDVEIQCTDLAVYDNANAHYLDLFLACKGLEGVSPKTIKQYRNAVIRFCDTMGVDVTRCNTDHVRAFLAYLATNGNSKVSVNNIRAYLSSFFKWMADEGYIERNIVAKIKKVKLEKRQRPVLTQMETEHIRRACANDREEALIELLLSTGMRCSEICNFKMSDIDFAKKKVLIHGKGSKDRYGCMTVPFEVSLKKYLNNRGYESEYVFGRSNGDHAKITDSAMERAVKKIAVRAGVENVVVHRFRHFFCTELLRKGMEIQYVQVLMGHASIETTAQVYNHINLESITTEFYKCCA